MSLLIRWAAGTAACSKFPVTTSQGRVQEKGGFRPRNEEQKRKGTRAAETAGQAGKGSQQPNRFTEEEAEGNRGGMRGRREHLPPEGRLR